MATRRTVRRRSIPRVTDETPTPAPAVPTPPEPEAIETKPEETTQQRVWVKPQISQGERADYAVAKDPSLHTRLVRDTPKRREYHERMGYQAIKADELKDHDGFKMADGYVRHGDRIVMATKKDWVEEREQRRKDNDKLRERRDEAQAMAEAFEDGRDDSEGAGFHTYHEDGRRSGKKMYQIPRPW